MPAELANVTVTVADSTWMAAGENVVASAGGAFGTFEVQSIPDATSVILKNLEDSGTGAYANNSPPATVFPNGTTITPSGLQGVPGIAPSSAPDDATYVTLSPHAGLTSEVPLEGMGSGLLDWDDTANILGTTPKGVADNDVVTVDDAAGLTNGEAVFATAAGIESQAAATARTSLGLGTMATQAAGAVAIAGGTITGITSLVVAGPTATVDFTASGETKINGPSFTAPTAIQSLLLATSIDPNAAKIRVVGSPGAVTLTATPTITTPGDDGQMLLIMGTSDVNTVTLQDEATLAGTTLQLGAATRLLGAGDHILLSWDATTGFWWEVAFTNN